MKNKSFNKEIDVRKTVGTTIIVVCAFLLFCLITRSAILGVISNAIANFFLGIFGLTAYAWTVAGIVVGTMILLHRKVTLPKLQIFNFSAMLFAAILLVHLITSQGSVIANDYATYLGACYDYTSMATFGGAFAGLFVWPLCNTISVFGTYAFVIALIILTVFICAEYFFKISHIKLEKEEKVVVQKETSNKQKYPQSKLFVANISENKPKAAQQKTSKSFNELYGDRIQNQSYQSLEQYDLSQQSNSAPKSAHEQLYGEYWQDTSYTTPNQPQRGAVPNTPYTKDFENYYSTPINDTQIKSAPISSFSKTFDEPPAILHGGDEQYSNESFNIRKTEEFLAEEKPEKRTKREEAKKDLYTLKGMMQPDSNLPPIVNGDEVSSQLKKKSAFEQANYPVYPAPRSFEEEKPVEEEKVEKTEGTEVFSVIKPDCVVSSNTEETLFEEDKKQDEIYKSVVEEKTTELYSSQSYESFDISPAPFVNVEDKIGEEISYQVNAQMQRADSFEPIFEEDLNSNKTEEVSVAEAVLEEETQQPVSEKIAEETIKEVVSTPIIEQEKEESVKYVEKPFINKTDKGFQVGLANVVGDDKKEERPVHKYKKYVPPIYSLLDDAVFDPKMMSENFEEKGRLIQETLAEFKIESTLRNIVVGPTVTRYEFEKAPGVSVTKVNSYLDDISLAVAAPGPVRLETPIPGKSLFGIEVPNKKVAKVPLRSVLESPEFLNTNKGLTFGLGIDIGGKKITADLTEMPHLLIAGSTGQGKSVCVNSIIISMLYKYGPEDLRFIMIDPKQVEFSLYEKLPHLMINNIICEPEKAIGAFDWLIKEMERRFGLFREYQERDIDGYNKAIDPETTQKLPRIVLIVDEVADLMQYNKSEIESRIQKLAQKARAAGIHLILATQRPSVDVITGVIKANFPARLALRVTSAADSRTIMQQGGPEKLVAKGDMLFQTGNMPEPVRLQGALILTDEVRNIVDYIAANNESYFDTEVADAIMKTKKDLSGGKADEEVDELFYDALKYVIDAGQASISMLQRRFSMGYNRAGRVLQEMEDRHFVSPYEGAKPRQVLITMEEYEQLFGDR